LAFGVDYTRLGQISSKISHIVCQSLAIPFCDNLAIILAVMADKSDEEIQIMEGFASTSDSDNRRCESIIWPNGMFWLYTHVQAFK
jgi:hypothetical protein